MDTITGLIAARSAQSPDRPALIYRDRRLSWSAFEARSCAVAGALAGLGVGVGDRVALWLPNTPAYLVLCAACARLGAIAVAVNTRFRSAEVGDIVGRSGAKLLAMWPGFRGIDFPAILGDVDPAALTRLSTVIVYRQDDADTVMPASAAHCRVVRYDELEQATPFDGNAAAPDLGCNIFTTSGTTKAPKFVLHSQAGITRHAHDVACAFGYGPSGGAMLQTLPLCGVFGFSQAMAGMAGGLPLVITSAFDADEAVALIDRYDVRHLNVTDDMVDAILHATDRADVLPSVAFSGYAAFDASLGDIVERADARGWKLCGLYGMSEVQALFSVRDPALPVAERRPGGGRLVSAQAAARVRDVDSGDLLPFGETGELELSGPSRMLGYFENPEATAATITPDGFVRTGDLGYMTDDRTFAYLSRMGDVLRLGGFLVSPLEIESHIQAHPGIDGCQVVGISTSDGPRAVAFVTLRPGASLDEDAVRRHCLNGLAKFKAPQRVIALPEFPTTKSANGTKIQRGRLREMAEQA